MGTTNSKHDEGYIPEVTPTAEAASSSQTPHTPTHKRAKTPRSRRKRMGRQREQQMSPPTAKMSVPEMASPVREWTSPVNKNPWVKRLEFDVTDQVLGTGTFANVLVAHPRKGTRHYRPNKPLEEQRVAAKVMEKRNIPDEMKYVIFQECNTTARLRHPNIIRILSAYEDPTHIYLFMPLLSGGDLHSFIESRGRLNEVMGYKIFAQLVDALVYAHSQNIVHRDIKLENIILSRAKKLAVQVVDFGFATEQRPDGPLLEDYPGSPAYAAPELTKGIPYRGRASDVWALGVTLYTMLAGQYPFWSEDVDEMYYRIAYAAPEFRASWGLSPSLRSLITAMLHKDPSQRPSMLQVRNHLWMTRMQQKVHPVRKPVDKENSGNYNNRSVAPASAKKAPASPFSKDRFKNIGRHFSSPLKQKQQPQQRRLRF